MLPQTVTVVCPKLQPNRVQGIKNVRTLTGLGLKEAKDVCDVPEKEHELPFNTSYFSQLPYPENALQKLILDMKVEGYEVSIGDTVNILLVELRKLGARAFDIGADQLASDISQFLLAEKFRNLK
jgi:hypothetical protein